MKITIEVPDNEIPKIQKVIIAHLHINKMTAKIVGNIMPKEIITEHEIIDQILRNLLDEINKHVPKQDS